MTHEEDAPAIHLRSIRARSTWLLAGVVVEQCAGYLAFVAIARELGTAAVGRYGSAF